MRYELNDVVIRDERIRENDAVWESVVNMESAHKKIHKMTHVSKIAAGTASAIVYLAFIIPRYREIIKNKPGYLSFAILVLGPVLISIAAVKLVELWFNLNYGWILNKKSKGGFNCFTNALHIAMFKEELKKGHITLTRLTPKRICYKIQYNDGKKSRRRLHIYNKASWGCGETVIKIYNNEVMFEMQGKKHI